MVSIIAVNRGFRILFVGTQWRGLNKFCVRGQCILAPKSPPLPLLCIATTCEVRSTSLLIFALFAFGCGVVGNNVDYYY